MRLVLLTLLAGFAVGLSKSPAAKPLRLTVNGSQLLEPTGNPIRLTGFNWVYKHLHDGDGDLMKKLIPGANVARLVALLWDNLEDEHHECLTNTAPYFKESCFADLDNIVRQATDAGVWVIIACRSKYGAGQEFTKNPDGNVFHNATLRSMMYTMWKHVAAHYASWDYIAAYEIMSEPRDKEVSAQVVHDFYADGCAAVHSVDPATPCMVGSRSYYKLYAFTDDIILKNDSNVIYTFDYFDPDDYVFGKSNIPTYPGSYECSELYSGWSSQCCRHGAKTSTTFDVSWHQNNFANWAGSVKDKYNVPVFVNQWGVVHGVSADQGRFKYMQDVAKSLQDLDMGWAWWVFRGGGGSDWSHGSMEFVFQFDNGTLSVDQQAVAAVQPYMGGKTPSKELLTGIAV